MAWMVSDGILEFKLACPRNKLSGDFHSKYGIFYDENGDRLCFNGSYNDSMHGLTNDETMSVYPSREPALERYVKNYEERFEKLWANKDSSVRVYDLPSAAKDNILELKIRQAIQKPAKRLQAIGETRKENHLNAFARANFAPRAYQREAIKVGLK